MELHNFSITVEASHQRRYVVIAEDGQAAVDAVNEILKYTGTIPPPGPDDPYVKRYVRAFETPTQIPRLDSMYPDFVVDAGGVLHPKV
jgi:hypothetical protein